MIDDKELQTLARGRAIKRSSRQLASLILLTVGYCALNVWLKDSGFFAVSTGFMILYSIFLIVRLRFTVRAEYTALIVEVTSAEPPSAN